MKKTFDCVEMKRKSQERIYEETCDFTPDKEIAYFHKAAEDFWKEIQSLRADGRQETVSAKM
ncbi:MAG TPA: hypothetical protein PLQ35_17500 [bacterium]|nr:hypothetical protein [bacterium]HQL64073.1 hypothetical protein [bacterium]